MTSATRRSLLKRLGLGGAALSWPRLGRTQDPAPEPAAAPAETVSFADKHDRVFLDGACWANPMEDWVVRDGMAECTTTAPNRNIHRLTHQLTDPGGGLEMSVVLSRVEKNQIDRGAGFRIGIRSELDEYRSNCFARNGLDAGVRDGEAFIGDETVPDARLDDPRNLRLILTGRGRGDRFTLTLFVALLDGTPLASVKATVPAKQVLGNVALVNSFSREMKGAGGAERGSRYRFNDWMVAGDAFTVRPERRFGPLLWSMYTLSDSRGEDGFVMKMSALTGPLGEEDNRTVELFVRREGDWRSLGTAELDSDAWVAAFRVPNWDATTETPYKLVYQERGRGGETTAHEWTGTVQPNPSGRPLRMAALTCQNDYGFPYEPVAANLRRLKPDLLYFSGDQIYESHGGYGLIRRPADRAILNYLRKYYQHGWSFREAMRNAPTVCLPDDHDVFQGNVWGEAGAPMDLSPGDGGASSRGGYIEPARMVNAVHRTTVAHHPDPADPTPVKQDISVYYGDLVYGDVSFAIVADRQWKSGPERVDTGPGRADHVADPDFDTSTLDEPGLVLLGERQEDFLKRWAGDWRGHSMKVLLSQTVFAGVATHHGSYDGYLKADLDSGAWPQTARDRAIRLAREGKPLHINGDQHLTTLAQYGVDEQRDGFWSFCTPAISAGYPRWWRPDEMGMPHTNRPAHGLPNTGEYTDGFGNQVYVYAVGNPEVASKKNRYERAHQKGSGFGFVTIDPAAKTYHIDSFRFLTDATDGAAANQFPGWPVTLHQDENAGRHRR